MNDKIFFNHLKKGENVATAAEVLDKLNNSNEIFHITPLGFAPTDLKKFVQLGSKLIIQRSDYGDNFNNNLLKRHVSAGGEDAKVVANGFLKTQLQGCLEIDAKVYFFGDEDDSLLDDLFFFIENWLDQVFCSSNENFDTDKLLEFITTGASNLVLFESELSKEVITGFIAAGKERIHIFPEEFPDLDIQEYGVLGASIVSREKP